MNVNQQVSQFTRWYGSGSDGSSPTEAQWQRLLEKAPETPVTLINFFKLRDKAVYPDGTQDVSGQDAFASYAAVSLPAMERAGGRFLHVGPFKGMFLGSEEDWDLVAVGAYPNLEALVALYADELYRGAFHHRTAACARQKVLISGDQG